MTVYYAPPNILRITPNGVLSELAATNVCLQASDYTQAAWAKTGVTVAAPVITAAAGAAPDLSVTADQVALPAVSAAGTASVVAQSITATAAAYTFSIWAKVATGTASTYLTITNGTTYTNTLCNLTTAWQRFTVTATLTAVAWTFQFGCDLRTGSGQAAQVATTLLAWGAQVELGTFPSTFIPTTTVGVARSADVISIPNPLPVGPFALDVTVTLYGNRAWNATQGYFLAAGGEGAANSWQMQAFTDGSLYFRTYDSAAAVRQLAFVHGFAAGSTHRLTYTHNNNGTSAMYIDGSVVAPTITGGAGIMTAQPATIFIGCNGAASFQLAGYLRNVSILKTSDFSRI